MEFPRVLGKYTLLGRLGRGGMGEVLAARVDGFRGIKKLCVIKTLKADLAADREYVARFLDEARVVMQLTHRNVCSVFDVGQVDGVYYLAMDLVRGRDLKTFWLTALEEGRPLEHSLALHILIEMLEGLDYAHRAVDENGEALGVVHRDVSPHNVMISFEGDVQLIDFGLAFHHLKREQTESSIVHGKAAYMPPEQIKGDGADVRADVFASAVVLYELLTGDRYYSAVPAHLLVAKAASGDHEPELWHTLDVDLRAILRVALSPDRERRTPSAGRLADELRAYVARKGLRADASVIRARMRDLFREEQNPWEGEEKTPAFPKNERKKLEPPREATRIEDSRSMMSAKSSSVPAKQKSNEASQSMSVSVASTSSKSSSRSASKSNSSAKAKKRPKPEPDADASESMSVANSSSTSMSAIRSRPASGVIPLPPDRGDILAEQILEKAAEEPPPSRPPRKPDPTEFIDRSKPTRVPSRDEPPPTMIVRDKQSVERSTRSKKRAPPPPPPPMPAARPLVDKLDKPEKSEKKEPKPVVRAQSEEPQSPARAALAGLALILMFVAFVFLAPWQKQSDEGKKKPLPDTAGVPEKTTFIKVWCPASRCLRGLEGKENTPAYPQEIDVCYQRCLHDQ